MDDSLQRFADGVILARLLARIECGSHDQDFDEIRGAIKSREQYLRKRKIEARYKEVSLGDEVLVSNKAHPVVLRGATGTVIGKSSNGMELEVKLNRAGALSVVGLTDVWLRADFFNKLDSIES